MPSKLALKATLISLLLFAVFIGAWQLSTQPKESTRLLAYWGLAIQADQRSTRLPKMAIPKPSGSQGDLPFQKIRKSTAVTSASLV